MAVIRVNKVDLYFNGNRILLSDGKTILSREVREYVESDKDRLHVVKEGETWESISFDMFGDSKYWHYLADINNVFNPFDAPPVGEPVIIPDLDNY